ncbi:MAG TPA: SCO family protein [Arenicellales bacterium]|nr:SCO family protein [Arenicellales bacterium]
MADRVHMRAAAALVCALLQALSTAAAQTAGNEFDSDAALARSQAAVGNRLDNYELVDTSGRSLRLSEFRGKPLLVSLIYTSCDHVCPMLTTELAAAVDAAREVVGADSFNVLSIGFDTRFDTPERMRLFAASRGIDDPRWTFAAVDAATAGAIADQLGFTYVATPRGFDHLAQVSVVDADGVVHQQAYGASMHQTAIVEPLKRLVWNLETDGATLSGWLKGVKLFCTVYDPNSGRYEFEYSFFIGVVIGILAFTSGGVFVFRAWREGSRTPRV